jgi:hypothetical protein
VGDGHDRGDVPAVAPGSAYSMNKAYLIILVPAVIVSLAWLTVGWGTRVSLPVGVVMLVVIFGTIFAVLRRKAGKPQAGRE